MELGIKKIKIIMSDWYNLSSFYIFLSFTILRQILRPPTIIN